VVDCVSDWFAFRWSRALLKNAIRPPSPPCQQLVSHHHQSNDLVKCHSLFYSHKQPQSTNHPSIPPNTQPQLINE
jgi:hypothetical protein